MWLRWAAVCLPHHLPQSLRFPVSDAPLKGPPTCFFFRFPFRCIFYLLLNMSVLRIFKLRGGTAGQEPGHVSSADLVRSRELGHVRPKRKVLDLFPRPPTAPPPEPSERPHRLPAPQELRRPGEASLAAGRAAQHGLGSPSPRPPHRSHKHLPQPPQVPTRVLWF